MEFSGAQISPDDIDSTSRRLPESCVEYMLFVIDGQAEPLQALTTVRRAANKLAEELTRDYIWQRDGFNLSIKSEKGLLYLHGLTNYGDSIEDEWLIVYILRELTKTFKSLWIRVFDDDGEFLLVEAASVAPKWLNPDLDANRVWLHNGQLRVVPTSLEQKGIPGKIQLKDALERLRTAPDTLVHSPLLEAEAFFRLEKYPTQIANHNHYARVIIPRKVAALLHDRPRAIAPAVECYYVRDPISMKPMLSASAEVEFPPDDLVTVSVRFTKPLFAQLKSQQVLPLPRWQSLLGKASDNNGETQALKMMELGLKLTCGFELMESQAQKSSNRVVQEVALLLEDIKADGSQSLPSDQEIREWSDWNKEDDESWLDIDYEDFVRELEGRRGDRAKSGDKDDDGAGFGGVNTHADLRKIVERFADFMNDDDADMDGINLGSEDDDDSDEDEDSEDEDKEVSFDEKEFALMMKHMMGLPVDRQEQPPVASSIPENHSAAQSKGATKEEDAEVTDIRNLTAQFETELKGHGALDLKPKVDKGKQKALPMSSNDASTSRTTKEQESESESETDDVDIDYNLAENLLESFKGQAGMAGPAGNILGMLGLTLPRDDPEDNADAQRGTGSKSGGRN